MVDLAIPVATGFSIVFFRAAKRLLDGRQQSLEEMQANAFADISAGALIAIGVSALIYALLGIEVFHLESSDVRILLAISGFKFVLEGMKHVQKNILSPFRQQG